MFVVSIFWSVMADVFAPGQGKRLFGFIGAGGTIGGIAGAALTSSLVGLLGRREPAAGLGGAARGRGAVGPPAVRAAARGAADESAAPRRRPRAIGGIDRGKACAARSSDPYLLNVTLHMLFFTVLTTFLYFQQATIVDAAIDDRVARTRFFANIDLAVNVLTLTTQTFATGRAVKRWGVTAALAFLPVLSVVGFGVLGLAPTIAVLMTFQVLRRAGNFAVARPAREVLFTVVPRARIATRPRPSSTRSSTASAISSAPGPTRRWRRWAPAWPASRGAAVALAALSAVNAVWLGRKMHAADRPAGRWPTSTVETATGRAGTRTVAADPGGRPLGDNVSRHGCRATASELLRPPLVDRRAVIAAGLVAGWRRRAWPRPGTTP